MAEALAAHGLHLSVVEALPQIMPNMDADMAAHVLQELDRQQVEVRLEQPVHAFEGKGRVQAVVAGGQSLPADLVIFSVGVKPGVSLAQQADLALGPTGAVAVDEYQRTSQPNIWAAGDVAEARHLVTGKPTDIPLGTTANKQGRVAGANAAGLKERFKGVAGTAVVKVFELEAARTGLSERQARAEGFEVETATIKASAQAHYMPGQAPLHVKLIFERGSQRLLGRPERRSQAD
jgi:CoA-dependent NAD(P)H sulfur oxidoreductase